MKDEVELIFRRDSAKIIARLMRIVRDLDVAEELAQDALLAAVEHWPFSGMPADPSAWLMQTAKNRAIDYFRQQKSRESKRDALTYDHELADHVNAGDDDELIGDDQLRLIFTCCHPQLSPENQVALTLKLIAGLSTREIARAYLLSEATVAQRLVRAKRTIKELALPYEVPGPRELPSRLPSVLEAIYLIFNEGYTAQSGERLVKEELCAEAVRLARLLTARLKSEPEALALSALLELHASRLATRVDAHGTIVLMADQDRSRWDRALIASGLEELEKALEIVHREQRALGTYAIQAAIAASHARAPAWADTDWRAIALLYERLNRVAPSPVVELNRAVAVSMIDGPAAALAIVDALAGDPALRDYHLFASARADFLRQLGRGKEAAAEYRRALDLTSNATEQAFLKKRIADCE